MSDGQFNDDDWIYTYQTGLPNRTTQSSYPVSPNDPSSADSGSRYGTTRTVERPVLSPAQALQAVLQEQSLSSNQATSSQELGHLSFSTKPGTSFGSESAQPQPILVNSEQQRPKLPANYPARSVCNFTPAEQKQIIQKLQQQQQLQQRFNYYQKYQQYNRQGQQEHFTLAPQQHIQQQPRIRQAPDRKSGPYPRNPAMATATRMADTDLMSTPSSNNTHIQLLRNQSLPTNNNGALILGVDNRVGRIAQNETNTILTNRSSPLRQAVNGTSAPIDPTTETILKFKNFLATLLRLAHRDDLSTQGTNDNPFKVNNLHQLICSLLEGSITTETFTRNLQQHFSSPNQPQLTPFLQRALPLARQMYSTSQFMGMVIKHAKELILKGTISAHQHNNVNRPQGHATAVSNGPSVVNTSRVNSVAQSPNSVPTKISRPLHVTLPVEIKTNGGSLWLRPNPQRQTSTTTTSSLQGPLVNITSLSLSNRQRISNSLASLIPATSAANRNTQIKTEQEIRTADDVRISPEQYRLIQRQQLMSGLADCVDNGETTTASSASNISLQSTPIVSPAVRTRSIELTPRIVSPVTTASQQESINGASASTAEPDDDLNDVTVMAGVNLLEEIKSCYQQPNADESCRRLAELDEPGFFNIDELNKLYADMCEREDLAAPDAGIAKFLSDFAEDFCRTVVRKAVDSARLRQHAFGRDDPNFTVVNETKRQLKFLEMIKRCEHQRRDALERERLMKAAKSRSKFDDPESEKLKQQAKELEKQEIEERRQQEANETALAAIGRKRRKTGAASNSDTTVNTTQMNRQAQVKRIVRVSLSDLLRVLEPMEFPNKTVLMTYAHEGMFTTKPTH